MKNLLNNYSTILNFNDEKPLLAIGCHNPLTAILGISSGFDAVWISSFEVSTSYGLPDASLISVDKYTQIIRDISSVNPGPIIIDADSGFGNIANTVKFCHDIKNLSVSGVCLEDNLYPKKCSFYAGKRELAEPNEHANKIRMAKKILGKDKLVIARVEALIARRGMDDALERARIYQNAGADMILIHSKSNNPSEVIEFSRRFKKNGTLLACVPTTYPEADFSMLFSEGFDLIISANHGIRTTIKAVKNTYSKILNEGKVDATSGHVADLDDVYSIVGQNEYLSLESGGDFEVHK